MKLLLNALAKFLLGAFLITLLLFLPAGSLSYTNGIVFAVLLFSLIFILGILLFFKSPALLEKRLNAKEHLPAQKCVVYISGLLFGAGFIVSGLDFRFGWSHIPKHMQICGIAAFVISFVMYAEVMRENIYLSRAVEIQKDQVVIDSGLYGIIRHPMYSATVIMFLAVPAVLDSWWAYLCFAPYIGIVVIRISNEEKLLQKELEGYSSYKEKVKYRLIPFIW